MVNKVAEGRPHIVDLIKNDEAAIIINTTGGPSCHYGFCLYPSQCRTAQRVLHYLPWRRLKAVCMALEQETDITVRRLQDLHDSIHESRMV